MVQVNEFRRFGLTMGAYSCAQLIHIGEISWTRYYSSEASSIDFRCSVIYGLRVLWTLVSLSLYPSMTEAQVSVPITVRQIIPLWHTSSDST